MAIARVDANGVLAVGFCPAVINQDNEPVHVPADSEDGGRVVSYLEECCTSEKLAVRLVQPTRESGLPVKSVQIVPQ
ncbi:hypothetical protein [Streptomyces sp. NPDC047009]|uniref:hypothetical protein n=1 Tax=unclassified Streptomyces TaxID=2593676 RepID=UPI00340F459C